jgi:hypothetical protein
MRVRAPPPAPLHRLTDLCVPVGARPLVRAGSVPGWKPTMLTLGAAAIRLGEYTAQLGDATRHASTSVIAYQSYRSTSVQGHRPGRHQDTCGPAGPGGRGLLRSGVLTCPASQSAWSIAYQATTVPAIANSPWKRSPHFAITRRDAALVAMVALMIRLLLDRRPRAEAVAFPLLQGPSGQHGHVLGAERGRNHDVAGDHRISQQPGELGQVVRLPGPQQQPACLDHRSLCHRCTVGPGEPASPIASGRQGPLQPEPSCPHRAIHRECAQDGGSVATEVHDG